MKKILIIGATSAIAKSCAYIWASKNSSIILVGRNIKKLDIIKTELINKGSPWVHTFEIDLNNLNDHNPMLDFSEKEFGEIDIVFIAHGILTNQKICENNITETINVINTNAISTISLLTEISKRFINKKKGIIAVITSVAGDRGRASNYIYGSTKSMVSTFISGLRQRLDKHNISVIDIKPGFIDTPMTEGLKKNFLWVKPSTIAPIIVKNIEKKRSVIYVPYYWKAIMILIKSIPEFIFKKINL